MREKNEFCRFRVVYSGRVQGVGFRWQVKNLSGDFEVAGFVRNLSDGTVELLVEEKEQETRGMIAEVDAILRDYWHSKIENVSKGYPQFKDFSIDYL